MRADGARQWGAGAPPSAYASASEDVTASIVWRRSRVAEGRGDGGRRRWPGPQNDLKARAHVLRVFVAAWKRVGSTAAWPSFHNVFLFRICLMKRLATATAQPTHSSLAPARGGDARHARRMQSRLRERELHNRQTQLLPHNGAAARTDHHSCRDNRPNTAGGQVTRPKVTCQMLNDTERMLLKAPNRHKSMLSAGRPTPLLFAPHTLCRMRPRHTQSPCIAVARHSLMRSSCAGLIFPTESSPPSGRSAERRQRPGSAAPHAISPAAASNASGMRRAHASTTPTLPSYTLVHPPTHPPTSPRSPLTGTGCIGRSRLTGRALAHPPGGVGRRGSPDSAEAKPTPAQQRRLRGELCPITPSAPLDRQRRHWAWSQQRMRRRVAA